jgi:integrase
VKNREDRLIVLNRIASSVLEEVCGVHPDHVFTYKGKPIQNINNSAWKRVRKKVGLSQVRVHDLKHTFGRRLRAAGGELETRKVLPGHRNGDITTRYHWWHFGGRLAEIVTPRLDFVNEAPGVRQIRDRLLCCE